jgi:hypothetical protein
MQTNSLPELTSGNINYRSIFENVHIGHAIQCRIGSVMKHSRKKLIIQIRKLVKLICL